MTMACFFEYGIHNGATLLLVCKIAIFVESGGQLMTMDVEDNATIGSVNALIHDRFGIPLDQQHLVFVHRTWGAA